MDTQKAGFEFELEESVMLITSVQAWRAEQRNEARVADNAASDDIQSMTLLEYCGPIEAGQVIGRSEFLYSENNYLVRYRCGDGRQVDDWVPESGLVRDPRPVPVE